MADVAEEFEAGPEGGQIDLTNTSATSQAGVASAMTFRAVAALFGSFGARWVTSAVIRWIQFPFGVASDNTYTRLYLRINSMNPTSQTVLATLRDTVNKVQLTMGSSSGAQVLNLRSGAVVVATTEVLPLDTWMRVEWDVVGLTQALRVYLGDNVHGDTPDQSISGTVSAKGTDSLRLGPVSSDTSSFDIDGFAASQSAQPGKKSPPVAPSEGNADAYYWNGTTMVAVDAFFWNGIAMTPVDVTVPGMI